MPAQGGWAALAGGAPVTTDRDAAREAAREELLNPAYHRHDPNLLQRAMNWLNEQLNHLLAGVGSAAHSGTTGLVLLLIAAAVLALVLRHRLGSPRRQARSAALFTPTGPRTAAEHRATAARHAAEAAWPEAVREQMRALVRALEERTLLDPRPGRTADEAAAEAGRSLPAHAAELTAAARAFDAVAYGHHPADQATYQRLVTLDHTLTTTRPTLTTHPTPISPTAGGPA
ncbi:hypothetical protein CFP65_2717 [Kitasatospora sp. MMS16-BH015]|uniref:DUF4129 domain-containing protein n=1 Tax=Kitasatospora sp. MMS16-BH015 TaxID=2018025 RepID=UPI000CA35FA2|nr:DUF4129 domain-containing protein [Kitasatospora sp. MMS16-BH015]AUG77538.1 hypothetical protein CFP65_2717 [Kitasatospora sp. MMS16-BH015]